MQYEIIVTFLVFCINIKCFCIFSTPHEINADTIQTQFPRFHNISINNAITLGYFKSAQAIMQISLNIKEKLCVYPVTALEGSYGGNKITMCTYIFSFSEKMQIRI